MALSKNMVPLETGRFYHIYNRGNNHENVFYSEEDYSQFLSLYEKYISTIADTYAWVLMQNHFHFLIRIKDPDEIGVYLPLNTNEGFKTENRFKTETNQSYSSEIINSFKKPDPSRHLSHLFNSYTKYINCCMNRDGSLFQKPFKRIMVNSIEYLKRLVVYIHRNPTHHGFTERFFDFQWSSYQSMFSKESTNIKREEIIEWFGDLENFRFNHFKESDDVDIEELFLE